MAVIHVSVEERQANSATQITVPSTVIGALGVLMVLVLILVEAELKRQPDPAPTRHLRYYQFFFHMQHIHMSFRKFRSENCVTFLP